MTDRPLRCGLAIRGRRPPHWETCQPCATGEDHHWVVVAGTHVSVVRASCPTGAREAVARQLFPARRRAHLPIATVTARPATGADIARFDEMVKESAR